MSNPTPNPNINTNPNPNLHPNSNPDSNRYVNPNIFGYMGYSVQLSGKGYLCPKDTGN